MICEKFIELFKSDIPKLEEVLHTVEEKSSHFRQHIHNINERLNLIEKRLDRIIEAIEPVRKKNETNL